MAVIIGAIAPRTNLADSPTLQLGGAWGAHALSIGGTTYFFASGEDDQGISAFTLGSDGSLGNIDNVVDNPALQLNEAANFVSVRTGGTTYLYVNSALTGGGGISSFEVASNGTLTSVENIADNLTLELGSSNNLGGKMALARVGTTTFLIAPGWADDGFSVFQVNADGRLTNTDNVTEGGALELDGALDIATATVGGRAFVFAAGLNDDGISVFELDAAGNATSRFNVDDASNPALQLNGAWGLATATIGTSTYLIASGSEDDGLSVFRVGGNGQLTNVDNVSDNTARALDRPTSLTTFTLAGETFVSVSGSFDNALGIFHLRANGTLADVTSIFDNAALFLNFTNGNTFANVGGVPLLIGAGNNANGVSVFSIGAGNDNLTGTPNADLILGLAGNDTIGGGRGRDEILGGQGSDILGGGAGDDILMGGPGGDLLRGGEGSDKLYGGPGRDTLVGGLGADDYIYLQTSASGVTGATRDRIQGFGGLDDIVLSGIDAQLGVAGNQAFRLDAGGGFARGEIRQVQTSAGRVLLMNTDADADAEMSILLVGVSRALTETDFVL